MSTLLQMKKADVLRELLAQRILVLDGSMGALIFSKTPSEADYRGERFKNVPKHLKNCTEVLVLTQPRRIETNLGEYRAAGADISETCTCCGTGLALAEFALSEHVLQIN